MTFDWKFEAWHGFSETMFSPEFVSVNWTGLVAGLFLGVALLSCIFSAASFGVLRQQFLLWYSARCIAIGVLALTLSPAYLGPFFKSDGTARLVLGFFSFDLMVALIGPFLAAYIEPGAIPGRLRTALFSTFPIALVFVPVYWMAEPPAAYYFARLVVYLAILLMVVAGVAIAVGRKSRTARFQLIGWGPILALNLINVPWHIATGNPLPHYLTLLFITLAVEIVVTALGITDRFLTLRQERDYARGREEMLVAMAQTDPLTGLANRRGLEAAFGPQVKALALFDLDHFKRVNDTFGHEVGDKVLVHTANALQSGHGLAARLGGEEFVVLFFAGDAYRTTEELRAAIARETANVEPGLTVTTSAGLTIVSQPDDLRGALREADELLYEAKTRGRNRTAVKIDAAPCEEPAFARPAVAA